MNRSAQDAEPKQTMMQKVLNVFSHLRFTISDFLISILISHRILIDPDRISNMRYAHAGILIMWTMNSVICAVPKGL